MKKLRRIVDHFNDEIEGVIDYVGDSQTVKEADPELAKAYMDMAKVECTHAQSLHTQYCRIVKELMAAEPESKTLAAIFEDQMQHMMRELAKAKAYLEVYGGGK